MAVLSIEKLDANVPAFQHLCAEMLPFYFKASTTDKSA